ncbi:hypothetical protein LCGC14_0246440 [marine sediment metagenome]|uniref:Uncharacterized protein n=1 Tax=marine sediment metagenome TaxID=412755 RepID=A0A0F9XAS1_9ZZZZ
MTSTEQILIKIKRQYGINIANRRADAIMFIGEAIEAIGYHTGFETVVEELTVSNYRVKKPYRFVGGEDNLSIFYGTYSLPLSRNQYNLRYPHLGDTEESADANAVKVAELQKEVDRYDALIITLATDPTDQDIIDAVAESQTTISSMTRALKIETQPIDDVVDSYNIQGDWIQTTFVSGTIEVHYKAFFVDETTEYPMIVDTFKYRQAVMWYVFSRLLLSGETHGEFNFKKADLEWDYYRDQARQEPKMPSIDMSEEFTNHWTRMSLNGRFMEEAFMEV